MLSKVIGLQVERRALVGDASSFLDGLCHKDRETVVDR